MNKLRDYNRVQAGFSLVSLLLSFLVIFIVLPVFMRFSLTVLRHVLLIRDDLNHRAERIWIETIFEDDFWQAFKEDQQENGRVFFIHPGHSVRYELQGTTLKRVQGKYSLKLNALESLKGFEIFYRYPLVRLRMDGESYEWYTPNMQQ